MLEQFALLMESKKGGLMLKRQQNAHSSAVRHDEASNRYGNFKNTKYQHKEKVRTSARRIQGTQGLQPPEDGNVMVNRSLVQSESLLPRLLVDAAGS